MIEGVNVLGAGASAYFVVVVLIGTYILLNLLVAVLLQLFSEDAEDEGAPPVGSVVR